MRIFDFTSASRYSEKVRSYWASKEPLASVIPARMVMSFGSHTPANGWNIVIDARMSSTRTSHAPGRKSSHTLSNVYFTIW